MTIYRKTKILILLFFFIILNYISNLFIILIFFIILILSVKLINIYSANQNSHDSSEIIIDEFLGINLIMINYDYIKFSNDLIMFIIIFLIFRFFDITKVYPANWIDKNIKNSWGVILDDIVAALYSVLLLYLVNVFV